MRQISPNTDSRNIVLCRHPDHPDIVDCVQPIVELCSLSGSYYMPVVLRSSARICTLEDGLGGMMVEMARIHLSLEVPTAYLELNLSYCDVDGPHLVWM